MVHIQNTVLASETEFSLLNQSTHSDIVSLARLKFFEFVDGNGTRKLPHMFYEGIMFGITADNSHFLQVVSLTILSIQ